MNFYTSDLFCTTMIYPAAPESVHFPFLFNMEDCMLITGGRIIDPANGLDTESDLLIQDGRIAQVVSQDGGL